MTSPNFIGDSNDPDTLFRYDCKRCGCYGIAREALNFLLAGGPNTMPVKQLDLLSGAIRNFEALDGRVFIVTKNLLILWKMSDESSEIVVPAANAPFIDVLKTRILKTVGQGPMQAAINQNEL